MEGIERPTQQWKKIVKNKIWIIKSFGCNVRIGTSTNIEQKR
jgi:hypothetical protein